MTDRPTEEAEESGTPVPKDLPDMDETGAGRRGAPHSGGVHPEQPVPDEAPG